MSAVRSPCGYLPDGLHWREAISGGWMAATEGFLLTDRDDERSVHS
jgi:hypothetical protein